MAANDGDDLSVIQQRAFFTGGVDGREQLPVFEREALPVLPDLVVPRDPVILAEAADDDDDCVVPAQPAPPTCDLHWQRMGNKPNIILAMAVGLGDGSAERPCDGDDRMLADFTSDPYVSLSQNSPYNPRQKILAAEIQRKDAIERAGRDARANKNNKVKPVAPNSWVKDRCLAWLANHPRRGRVILIAVNDPRFMIRIPYETKIMKCPQIMRRQ